MMRALQAEGGGLVVPREFVFLERATIGLGGAFLRLGARLNFHRLYEDAIAGLRRGRGGEAAGGGAGGGGAREVRAPRARALGTRDGASGLPPFTPSAASRPPPRRRSSGRRTG